MCAILGVVTITLSARERGWLLGSAGFFNKDGFLENAHKASLVITCKGRKTVVQADELGDYGIQLAHCKYKLIEVIGPSGDKLLVHANQARTFAIKDGATTRFDVMISKPSQITPIVR